MLPKNTSFADVVASRHNGAPAAVRTNVGRTIGADARFVQPYLVKKPKPSILDKIGSYLDRTEQEKQLVRLDDGECVSVFKHSEADVSELRRLREAFFHRN